MTEGSACAQESFALTRVFTTEGVHPFAEVEWKKSDAVILDAKGEEVFRQDGVEFPDFWSQQAINITASKYFRGHVGEEGREVSLKQVITRVVSTIVDWGIDQGYLGTNSGTLDDPAPNDPANVLFDELTHILLHQKASFNSPVWFNFGVEEKPQASACFINGVEDNMESIMNLARNEVMIFKGGSGSGVNVSNIRAANEKLSRGGKASGPLSFMSGLDAFSGAIKSGGRTRRAAKMVIMDVDHPDIVDFIHCKVREEEKAKMLVAAGVDDAIDGEAYATVDYQNANNTVRVNDDFMNAAIDDLDWTTYRRTDGFSEWTRPAKEILEEIAKSAHSCGDPGLQFDNVINQMNTCPNTGRISASNPCVTGDTLVSTDRGLCRIDSLVGSTPVVFGSDGELWRSTRVIETGMKPVYKITTKAGYSVKATADHLILTKNRGDVRACDLRKDDRLVLGAVPFGSRSISSENGVLLGATAGDGCTCGETTVLALDKENTNLSSYLADVVNAMKVGKKGAKKSSVTQAPTASRVSASHEVVRSFIAEYVVADEGANLKRFHPTIFDLDKSSVAGVLRGLFETDGTVADYGEKSQYVSLDSTSLVLLEQVQLLLLGFGIKSKIYRDRNATKNGRCLMPDGKGGSKEYDIRPFHSLRISRHSRVLFQHHIDFLSGGEKAKKLSSLNERCGTYRDRMDDPVKSVELHSHSETVYDLTEPATNHFVGNGLVVHNCSEFMWHDNSACNLSSINLLRFIDGQSFKTEDFIHAVRVLITAMEIIVDGASYPTEEIAKVSHESRPLGLGYAGLGGMLMRFGLPYDSTSGRKLAAAITSLMTAVAYERSAELAKIYGSPHQWYEGGNIEATSQVIDRHAASHAMLRNGSENTDDRLRALYEVGSWAWVCAKKKVDNFGVRNSQLTLLAPTGTISFMMDCDTTGIEPVTALISAKALVGGGYMKMVSPCVEDALKSFGNSQADSYKIAKEVQEGSPINEHIKSPDHLKVFETALEEEGHAVVSPKGHLDMVAAVQPFLSGAISKTINMPNSVIVDDIVELYKDAWRSGVKAIAIYRDGSKSNQPVKASSSVVEVVDDQPVRHNLPDDRPALNHKFSVSGHDGYLTIGYYEDGRPGEVFLRMAKAGSVIAGFADGWALMTSLALQYGVPIEVIVEKFAHSRFEPSGFTTNPQIPIAKSILDYVARYLGQRFLEDQDEIQATDRPVFDAQLHKVSNSSSACRDCGGLMERSGSCYRCINCGSSDGCS